MGGCATLEGMSMPTPMPGASPLKLEFPQSLAVYDDYAAAQKTVDYLSDQHFPVQHLMIVGTDLKRVERITGRLTTGRVALGGVLSGLWLGLFVGLVFAMFVDENAFAMIVSTMLFGAVFGLIWALIGYALTYFRDFVAGSLIRRAPDEKEAAALLDLDDHLGALAEDAGAEEIQHMVFEVGKAHGFENLRDWFKALYETLLGTSQGPRMGSFIALYGVANSRKLIAEALAA